MDTITEKNDLPVTRTLTLETLKEACQLAYRDYEWLLKRSDAIDVGGNTIGVVVGSATLITLSASVNAVHPLNFAFCSFTIALVFFLLGLLSVFLPRLVWHFEFPDLTTIYKSYLEYDEKKYLEHFIYQAQEHSRKNGRFLAVKAWLQFFAIIFFLIEGWALIVWLSSQKSAP